MRSKSVLALLFLVLLPTGAFAQLVQLQQNMLVAAASSSGTYAAMLSEIKDVCLDENLNITTTDTKQGGATDNLAALKENRVQAAFLHSDVIYAAAQSDPDYRLLKTLVALYPEEIHVVALRNSITKKPGIGGFVSGYVQFNTLSDLAGYTVGASGGSYVTAQILKGQGEGKFLTVEFPNGGAVLNALKANQIQAAIFVGGSPLPNIVPLKAEEYKLLPIGESIAARVTGVYRPATINYRNLNSGSIKTLAASALILTRKYTIHKMIAPQAAFRQCFYDKLDELKETPGKHPKWQQVDPKDHGVWEWYELPEVRALGSPIAPNVRRNPASTK